MTMIMIITYISLKRQLRKASELFFIKSKHQNSTFEHSFELSDMSVVESWLIEDPKER